MIFKKTDFVMGSSSKVYTFKRCGYSATVSLFSLNLAQNSALTPTYISGLGLRSFAQSLFRWKSLILKSNLEWFAHVTLYKRATWVNSSLPSLKRAMWVIRANCSQKTSESLEKFIFLYLFHQFSPSLCPRVNCSRHSFLKSDLSD